MLHLGLGDMNKNSYPSVFNGISIEQDLTHPLNEYVALLPSG